MSDIPTLHFRFVKRQESVTTFASWPLAETRTKHILQQLFQTGRGREWRDVPVVEESSDV